MKRQLFIILLLGTSVCLSWGQNGPKKYYEYINKAELAYLEVSDNNDFGQKAASYYEEAFAVFQTRMDSDSSKMKGKYIIKGDK